MPFGLNFVAALLAVYLLAELINLACIGKSTTVWIVRAIRRKLNGSKEIEMPPGLQVAAANGLLSAGMEVVAGSKNERVGTSIARFAVAAELLGEKEGTRMKVLKLRGTRMEVKPLA